MQMAACRDDIFLVELTLVEHQLVAEQPDLREDVLIAKVKYSVLDFLFSPEKM